MCISPRREDFVTYKPSKVKIKDLSKINKVDGEGMIRWKVRDKLGNNIVLELPGYHIPNAEVRLLSPQVLLATVGGQAIQTTTDLRIHLNNGISLVARYCPHSNLPLLPCCENAASCFWSNAFKFSDSTTLSFSINHSVLMQYNDNMSESQKELILWHQRLSHASISWIQPLMRDHKWLKSNYSENSLHQGPFIPCKELRTTKCNTQGLKCAACQMAKACTRSPGSHESHDAPANNVRHNFDQILEGKKIKQLKRGHTRPGDCVSADHYISAVTG